MHIKASREDWEQLKETGKFASMSNLEFPSLPNTSTSVYFCGDFDSAIGTNLDSAKRLTRDSCFSRESSVMPAPHTHHWAIHFELRPVNA
ncbi:uncharacterized protein B0T23DRAFT_325084 [Neurospora hispaniola]|uniref:Uncharacterized protein n=1 Tax=Neurospora hispaniola TaxID=588809 RepID=A0AAJ0I062_9PEZI|nr:hypothetical protein B0T23DRAFT_325084 [Neurospora hispaniola]